MEALKFVYGDDGCRLIDAEVVIERINEDIGRVTRLK